MNLVMNVTECIYSDSKFCSDSSINRAIYRNIYARCKILRTIGKSIRKVNVYMCS